MIRGVQPFIVAAAKERRRAVVKLVICGDHCDEPGAMGLEAINLMTWENADKMFNLMQEMADRSKK